MRCYYMLSVSMSNCDRFLYQCSLIHVSGKAINIYLPITILSVNKYKFIINRNIFALESKYQKINMNHQNNFEESFHMIHLLNDVWMGPAGFP